MFLIQNPHELGLFFGHSSPAPPPVRIFAGCREVPRIRRGPAVVGVIGFWAYPASYPCTHQITCLVACRLFLLHANHVPSCVPVQWDVSRAETGVVAGGVARAPTGRGD